jgi:hypothetical protein
MTGRLGVSLGLFAVLLATAGAVDARPMVLTARQLDRVAAGGVFLDVVALAGARGPGAVAVTSTQATLVHTPFVELGIGTAMAGASACCGAGAQLGAAALGAGAGNSLFALIHDLGFGTPGPARAVSIAVISLISSVDGGLSARPGFRTP